MPRPSRRSFWFVSAAIAVLILILTFLFERQGLSQMASSGAKDQPVRPLPRGMKAPAVDFRDVAAQAGLSAVVVSGELDQTTVVENTGTGVAIFDYDNDGLPDIFLVQGDRLKSVGAPLTPHLYHNLEGLRFEDVTEKAGIGHTGWGQGVCAGDPDKERLRSSSRTSERTCSRLPGHCRNPTVLSGDNLSIRFCCRRGDNKSD
jgi:hypothetical protein